MSIFKKNKSSGYVDLGEHLQKKEEKAQSFKENNFTKEVEEENPTSQPESSGGFFNFFGGQGQAKEVIQPEPEASSQDERKKKLNKILRDLTQRLESQENEIFQLKQKVETLEKKQRLDY